MRMFIKPDFFTVSNEHPMGLFLLLSLAVSLLWLGVATAQDVTDVDDFAHEQAAVFDAGRGGAETTKAFGPGVVWTHRQTSTQNIHYLRVDLTNPAVRISAGHGHDAVSGRETTSTIARSQGARAALNADFCNLRGPYAGVPQNIYVRQGVLKVGPRYRTSIGFAPDKRVRMGFWVTENPPGWTWSGRLRTAAGAERPLIHLNLDVAPGWVCAFTDDFRSDRCSLGNHEFHDGVEVIVDASGTVSALRANDQPFPIPQGGYCYIGRGEEATWLQQNMHPGEQAALIADTTPAWQGYQTIVGGGPAIVKAGRFYADPIKVFPDGEDFTLEYKHQYYKSLHPRSLIGLSQDHQTLILAVVDGRALRQGRRGMTLEEAATLMLDLGAYEAMSMDGGGSATMYLKDFGVVNHPSDGTERAVANALLIF